MCVWREMRNYILVFHPFSLKSALKLTDRVYVSTLVLYFEYLSCK